MGTCHGLDIRENNTEHGNFKTRRAKRLHTSHTCTCVRTHTHTQRGGDKRTPNCLRFIERWWQPCSVSLQVQCTHSTQSHCSLGTAKSTSAHGDGDINAKVAILGKELCNACVKHQTVAVHDGCGDAFMDGAWRCLPGKAAPVPIKLQAVGKALCLLARPDELYNGEELLVPVVLLLLLQHQHEVETEAGLHHHPVDGTG